MNADIRFYLAIFMRRLPLFLLVFVLIASSGIFAALTLPPVYRAQMQIVVEGSQIPDKLAQSTVNTPAEEQLQLFESRLMTRSNLLEIARKYNVLPDQATLNPDQIVQGMRAATDVESSSGRNSATTMVVTFDNHNPQVAAKVVNDYLTFILNEDARNRTETANQTQEFFENEVSRLATEMNQQSARILKFKTEHADALPENQSYFRTQQRDYQRRLDQISSDAAALEKQKSSLRQIYETTGRIDSRQSNLPPEQKRLLDLKAQLAELEAVYAPDSARVTVIKNRITQLEKTISGNQSDDSQTAKDPSEAVFDLQIADLDRQLDQLKDEQSQYTAQLAEVEDALSKIPANAIALEALQRDYDNAQSQYNGAVQRLATASTGERIESLSRGQRVSVIEQPAVPTEPIKPSRKKIAVLGIAGGIMAGLGLIVLIEMLSTTVKRSSDLINGLGITPLATIPYMRTQGEVQRNRKRLLTISLIVCLGIPFALLMIHTFYMPFEVIAQKIAAKVGLYI
ncbi:hypothetical protein [Thioclava sp. FTW29]|uniref:Polysaccharide chain length determinant protein, PEP-CTERM locus subfamily n=1 Tax=Thioclava litoralis TaxID=3076557 RepID=A0ABZ1E752_9RHOB|nr:hypothetical protein RPE78_16410 [Thioclava sp. FTW29]